MVVTHDEAYAELAAVALDALPSDVCAAVREHAAACPECGPELAAMEETVAQLGHLAPQRTINRGRGAGIRSRLVMRARAEREARSTAAPGPPDLARGVASLTGLGHKLTPGSQRAVEAEIRKSLPAEPRRSVFFSGSSLLAAAAVIAFAVSGIELLRVTRDRDALREQLSATAARPVSADTGTIAKEAVISAMAGADVKIVPLATSTATRMGHMFWNQKSNEWTMVVDAMNPPKQGMTYQLWLVTDTSKISAGTFMPDSTGHVFMQMKHALDKNALKAVAVTEEPMGGMPSPTGPIIVSGSAAP